MFVWRVSDYKKFIDPYADWGARPEPILIDGHRVGLSRNELAIFSMLYNARGQRVATSTMIDTLWGDDEDGGPDMAMECVRVTVHRLKNKLKPTRFRIVRGFSTVVGCRGYSGWKLERLCERALT